MIRIDEIYSNTFWSWIKNNRPGTRMFACHPFGRTDPDSVIDFGMRHNQDHDYVFFLDQEPISLDQLTTFEQVSSRCSDVYYKRDPGQSQLGYLVTSEQHSSVVDEICTRFGWRALYYFYHGWAALDWYRGYDKTFLIQPTSQRRITKTFVSPNRIIGGKRQHRLEMLYWIFRNGMANNHISCPVQCPAENISIIDAVQPLRSRYPDIAEVFAAQSLPRNFAGETDHPMHSCWLSLFDQCAESLLYLVTETVATGQRWHLTEKTFKPIAMGMPFVIVGTQGSLKYLRSYGFKTFEGIWDESYDDAQDQDRISRIGSLLRSLDELPPEAKQDLFLQALPIIEHNWNHFYNGGFEAVLWRELNDMLQNITAKDLHFNLVYDSISAHGPHPNLAGNDVSRLGVSYPNVDRLRLEYYSQDHGYPIHTQRFDPGNLSPNSFYPIGLAFFRFDVDYFALLPAAVRAQCAQGTLKILFYYHEGDNPFRQKERLDQLCDSHGLPSSCYRFVSGNTQAQNIPGFAYFPDHELFYWRHSVRRRGQDVWGCEPHTGARSRQFTVLSRTHKWWRATVMSYMHKHHWLDRSYWSYGLAQYPDMELPDQNPIETWELDIESYMQDFVNGAPYHCDSLTQAQHNQHSILVPEHYQDSYCNLVLETEFDQDQSMGSFLTEKTFKPIRHGQPFVIFGPPGSLAMLRKLGYRTFDRHIDNSYDLELDNTKRFRKLIGVVQHLANQDLHEWYQQCLPDIEWNQLLYKSSKYSRLYMLHQQLTLT